MKTKFLKEAKNIAKLNHPGIIKIQDIFEENDTAYYIMDFIEGISLKEIVIAHGKLSPKIAITYITQVGEALSYIHSRHMMHLDIIAVPILPDSNNYVSLPY